VYVIHSKVCVIHSFVKGYVDGTLPRRGGVT
jgi:hypothetical protein